MIFALSRNWWMIALRGVFAILFGFAALVVPGLTLTALVLLFGAYVLVDGVISIGTALTHRASYDNWWMMLLEGVIGIFAGIATFAWPGITALVLLYIIAFWALITGGFEIAAAIQLRREMDNEWLLGLAGALSILFGVVLIIAPGSGALGLIWLIGLYSLVFGGMLIALGFRVKDMDPEQRDQLISPA